jgi:uncharacterized protein (TIGR03083 family)
MAVTETLTLESAHVRGFALVQDHTGRFVAYIEGLGDENLGRRITGSDWTVGETIAHLQSVYLRYTTDRRRAPSPQGVAEQNAEDIGTIGVDVAASLASMEEQVGILATLVPHIAPDQRFPFHAGQMTTLAGGWGNLLGELLAHGDDIARATGSPFAIPSRDLEILWRFTAPLLQGWIRPEAAPLNEEWRLRFPFGDIDAVFDRRVLRWGEGEGSGRGRVLEVDDAAELALAFPYRRRVIEDPALALLATRFYDL